MKMCAGFLVGMGAGLVTGAALGMMTPYGKDSMKTDGEEIFPSVFYEKV